VWEQSGQVVRPRLCVFDLLNGVAEARYVSRLILRARTPDLFIKPSTKAAEASKVAALRESDLLFEMALPKWPFGPQGEVVPFSQLHLKGPVCPFSFARKESSVITAQYFCSTMASDRGVLKRLSAQRSMGTLYANPQGHAREAKEDGDSQQASMAFSDLTVRSLALAV
jgi:hypothetical protein